MDYAYHWLGNLCLWDDDSFVRRFISFCPHTTKLTIIPSLPIQLYLVDSFQFAASAVAAAALFRSLLGFAFPLFGKQMFDAMGVGGGNSVRVLQYLKTPFC